MKLLSRRMEDVRSGRAELPLVVMESMLPKQRLDFWTSDPTFCEFLSDQGKGSTFGMVGVDPTSRRIMRKGMEVRVSDVTEEKGGIRASLSGDRLFRMLGSGTETELGRFRRQRSEDGQAQPQFQWGSETAFVSESSSAAGGGGGGSNTAKDAADAIKAMARRDALNAINGATGGSSGEGGSAHRVEWLDPDAGNLFFGGGFGLGGGVADDAAVNAGGAAAAAAYGISGISGISGDGGSGGSGLVAGAEDIAAAEASLVSGVSGDGRLSGGSGGGGGDFADSDDPFGGQAELLWSAMAPQVDLWLELVQACGLERQPGHLEGVLELLGPAPPPSRPGALALWLAALLNPIPPLGVAPELRPRVLLSPSPDERLAVVYAGLARSLAHLEDTRRGGGGGGSRASISW